MNTITKNLLLKNNAPYEIIKIFEENFSKYAKVYELLVKFAFSDKETVNGVNWLMNFLHYYNTTEYLSSYIEMNKLVSTGNVYRNGYINVTNSVYIKGDYIAKRKIAITAKNTCLKAKNVFSDEIVVKNNSYIWADLVKTKILRLEDNSFIQGKLEANKIYIDGKLYRKG